MYAYYTGQQIFWAAGSSTVSIAIRCADCENVHRFPPSRHSFQRNVKIEKLSWTPTKGCDRTSAKFDVMSIRNTPILNKNRRFYRIGSDFSLPHRRLEILLTSGIKMGIFRSYDRNLAVE